MTPAKSTCGNSPAAGPVRTRRKDSRFTMLGGILALLLLILCGLIAKQRGWLSSMSGQQPPFAHSTGEPIRHAVVRPESQVPDFQTTGSISIANMGLEDNDDNDPDSESLRIERIEVLLAGMEHQVKRRLQMQPHQWNPKGIRKRFIRRSHLLPPGLHTQGTKIVLWRVSRPPRFVPRVPRKKIGLGMSYRGRSPCCCHLRHSIKNQYQ